MGRYRCVHAALIVDTIQLIYDKLYDRADALYVYDIGE